MLCFYVFLWLLPPNKIMGRGYSPHKNIFGGGIGMQTVTGLYLAGVFVVAGGILVVLLLFFFITLEPRVECYTSL